MSVHDEAQDSFEQLQERVAELIPDDGKGGVNGARDIMVGATIIDSLITQDPDSRFRLVVCMIAAAMFRRHSFLEMDTAEGADAAGNVLKVGDALAILGHRLMEARAGVFNIDAIMAEARKVLGEDFDA